MLVALESLACGTPVVATDVGAMQGIIQEGQTGCVVAKATPRLLAKSIETVFSAFDSNDSSAAAIRASVTGFDWPNVAEAM